MPKIEYSWSKPLLNERPPSQRGGHSVVFADNHLIIFGGHYYDGGEKFTYLNETWALNLETSTWHQIHCGGEIPNARFHDHI